MAASQGQHLKPLCKVKLEHLDDYRTEKERANRKHSVADLMFDKTFCSEKSEVYLNRKHHEQTAGFQFRHAISWMWQQVQATHPAQTRQLHVMPQDQTSPDGPDNQVSIFFGDTKWYQDTPLLHVKWLDMLLVHKQANKDHAARFVDVVQRARTSSQNFPSFKKCLATDQQSTQFLLKLESIEMLRRVLLVNSRRLGCEPNPERSWEYCDSFLQIYYPYERSVRYTEIRNAVKFVPRGVVPDEPQCASCKTSKAYLKKCSACKRVAYCSVDCQKKDWVKHKAHCQKEKQPSNDHHPENASGITSESIFQLVRNLSGHGVSTTTAARPPAATAAAAASSSSADSDAARCATCRKTESTLRKCSACKRVAYCSVACQKKDWIKHKTQCEKAKN